MELSQTLQLRSHRLPFFPIQRPLRRNSPTSQRFNFTPDRPFSNTKLTVSAMRKPPIEGLSDDLNAIARRNLDFAYTRRQVHEAFKDVQLELDHCLFKTAPAGIRTEEWYERNLRGLEIFCKSWMPKPGVPIKAAVCFCHGYGDTCTFFFEGIARRIAGSGYAVYAMDYPGFGLSEGLHGYIPNFDYLVDDVIEHYRKIKARPELRGLPRFILGQSMGGAVTLKVHLKEPNNWDGVLLVAPMCKVADDLLPPDAVLKALAFLSKVMPKGKLLPQRDLAELAFREPSKRKLAVYNVICYEDQMRLRTGMELLRATKDIESQVQKGRNDVIAGISSIISLHGADDKVTDPKVSQFLYEKASSKDKTIKIYEGGYHCILEGEPDDRIYTVHDDIISWLNARCAVKSVLHASYH